MESKKLSETLEEKRKKNIDKEIKKAIQIGQTIQNKLNSGMSFEQIMEKYYWIPTYGKRWEDRLMPKLAEAIERIDYKEAIDNARKEKTSTDKETRTISNDRQ